MVKLYEGKRLFLIGQSFIFLKPYENGISTYRTVVAKIPAKTIIPVYRPTLIHNYLMILHLPQVYKCTYVVNIFIAINYCNIYKHVHFIIHVYVFNSVALI